MHEISHHIEFVICCTSTRCGNGRDNVARFVLTLLALLVMWQSSISAAETAKANAVNQKNGGLNEEECSDGSLRGDCWAKQLGGLD